MKVDKKRSKIDSFFAPVSLITPPLLKTAGDADQATTPNDSEESSVSDVDVCFDNDSHKHLSRQNHTYQRLA